jgi:heterodisulfide reductase subunit B
MDWANRLVADRLSLGLVDLDWTCCGGVPATAAGPELRRQTATLNLAKTREAGSDTLVTGCAACVRHLELVARELAGAGSNADRDDIVRARQEKARGVTVRMAHEAILEALLGHEPRPEIARPLLGLKVAAYYGCRSFADDSGRPREGRWTRALEEGLEHRGATVVPFGGRGECNGGILTLSRSEIVEERTTLLTHEAREAGAEALVVVCPLCHLNLTTRPLDEPLPLLYFAQAAGIALGMAPGELGLTVTSPGRRLLKRVGLC